MNVSSMQKMTAFVQNYERICQRYGVRLAANDGELYVVFSPSDKDTCIHYETDGRLEYSYEDKTEDEDEYE
jgi:hypothetical protein